LDRVSFIVVDMNEQQSNDFDSHFVSDFYV